MDNSILVTGVPGWLGSRFVEILAGGNRAATSNISHREVRCLVLRGQDVTGLKDLGVRVFEGDVRDRDSLGQALKNVDVVFHLAGITHPKTVREFYEVNFEGTRNLIDAAISAGVRRFVFISSNSPGGYRKDCFRLMEENDPPRPYKGYGSSKYLAEKYLLDATKNGKIEGIVLRPFWYYGPGQPARQTRFFKMIQRGNPIVFGNGGNLRSMSYIDNTIQAMLLVETNEKAVGRVYYIADRRPYPVSEIYATIARLLGVEKLRSRFLPNGTSKFFEFLDDGMQFFGLYSSMIHVAGEMDKNIACSIEKAERELGYKPKIELEEGMRRSILWCKQKGLF